METKPVKILEITGDNWYKGLSFQTQYPIGGLFQTATNFDPFEKIGYMQPSLASITLDTDTITTQIDHLASYQDGGIGYVYGLGDRAGTGGKCLYRIKLSDNTVTEHNASIDTNATTGALTHNGATIFRNRLIYEQAGSLRSITIGLSSDANILTTANSASTLIPTRFVEGSDGNLYYTANQGSAIGKIVTETTTTSNTNSVYDLGTGNIPKDVTFDGRYLVSISDNNDYLNTEANTACQVRFYDLDSATNVLPVVTWDIPDAYLIGGRYVNGRIVVIGYSGIWICNIATPPQLVYPLTSSKLPANANQITTSGNTLYWASASLGGKVFSYGSTIGNPIVYQPYTSTGGSDLHTAIIAAGDVFVSSTDGPNAYVLNDGSTRANATVQNATIQLPLPYRYSHTKVTLQAPMSSGQSVQLSIFNGNGSVISDTRTKSFTTDGAKQTLIFEPVTASGYFKEFEDIYISLASVSGPVIQRVTVYGYPEEDFNQNI